MKLFNLITALLIAIIITGCKTTATTSQAPLADNNTKYFSHVAKGKLNENFKTVSINVDVPKKPLYRNDLALKQRLLDRPMTPDMQLMLAFSTSLQSADGSVGIRIRGNKVEDPISRTDTVTDLSDRPYSLLPQKTVAILGPKQAMP
ncbi:hypothetical protein J7384_17375 [Endozoicomonas sp. G2_1]|uniref:hypothetical protein n=1 Tax=Endozoicomonas sp. G2_1 TaxID=2821091 RepID=UPI001ADAFDFB|nr:hypothetical protein [Endozoicomonas sp. G2_1]MBO9492135.1 hypothetical protein [Endozoicomonas sp. G2_1]